MTEIEKIKRYIADTKMPDCVNRYEVPTREIAAMIKEMDGANLAIFALNYGRAKGYRAAKAERKAVQG